MADYPPTPPFSMVPSRAVPPYREISHRDIYDHGDAGQLEQPSLLDYHKAQTRTAYEQNARLQGFSADTVASSIPPLPIYQDQESLLYSYQPTSYPRGGTSEPARPNLYNISSNPPSLEAPQKPSQERNHMQTPSRNPAALNVEEGELSEGEFEEARSNMNSSTAGGIRRHDYYERQREDHHLSAYGRVYSSNGEHQTTSNVPLTDIYGRSLDLNRHHSESYSPYEPPNEVEYEPQLAQEILVPRRQLSYQEEYGQPAEYSHVQKIRPNEYRSGSSRVESLDSLSHNYREQKGSAAHMDVQSRLDTPGLNAAVKSLHDARKEAQNAILNLLPLKVRYQDYLDEGIDEEIVRRQFESLGVPLAPAEIPLNKQYGENTAGSPLIQSYTAINHDTRLVVTFTPSSPKAPKVNRDQVQGSASLRANLTLSEITSTNITKGNDRALDNLNTVESRKDRIARLLAEKAKKQQSLIVQSESPLHSASPEAPILNKATTTSQSAAKADKEKLLRQKMEALQKSREQRAQKAAAKTATAESATTTDTAVEHTQMSTEQLALSNQNLSGPPLIKSTSPSSDANKQAVPSIPGLFLASAPKAPQSPASSTIASNTVQNGMHRKRPVASDFDGPSSNASFHKRPFGQNKNDQPLVIDVSEDDSDDGNYSEMDIDYPQTVSSGNRPQNSASITKYKAIRDLPPLSDFPPRKLFPTPSSAIGTPTASQFSKTSVSKPEDLHRKELEIQEMKRKIAQAERRKKAKQNSSGSQTPRPPDATNSPAKNNGVSLADKIEASIQIEHLIDDASRQVDQDQQKLAEARVDERVKVDELKRSEAEWKKLRRAEIASNLPVVDAEVEKAQRQLADLRAEMVRIEAAVQKGLDDKRRLAEEMEKLGQEADEELQAQRDKLGELKLEAKGDINASNHAEQNELAIKSNTPPSVEEIADNMMSDAPPSSNPGFQHTVHLEIDNNVSEVSATVPLPKSTEMHIAPTQAEQRRHSRLSPQSAPCNQEDNFSVDVNPGQALEAVLQEAIAQAGFQPNSDLASDVDMADSFAPDPHFLAPASTDGSTGCNQQDNDLSESGEERVDIADGESEPYEPPDATTQPADVFSSLDSPPFSPAPPETISGSSQADKQRDETPTEPEHVTPPNAATHANEQHLPLTQASQDNFTQTSRKTFFTPYESPLKIFRAFRFHPTFEQEVRGGFKSITYSNNIKGDTELCRYELAGGVCNDASCEFQHFKDMGLADDAILVELGNSAGYSEDDKPRFVAGLRTVLQGLRAKKTKDFHVIASEIAAYRARFLGDESKVLFLEETST